MLAIDVASRPWQEREKTLLRGLTPPPIRRPERFLVAFSLRSNRSALRTDALELFPASRLALS